jgi:hypothetical protein
LSAAAYSIYSQLTSKAEGRLFHPEPEDAPCYGDKGTNLTWPLHSHRYKNYAFQIFLLLGPEISAGFTSYIVKIIPIIHFSPVTTEIYLVSFDLIILSILHQTMD